MTATSNRCGPLLWRDAGEPPGYKPRHTSPDGSLCCVCGDDVLDGVMRSDQFGVGFSDFDSLYAQTSEWVCAGCSWALGSKPPATLRTWSVVYREDWTIDEWPDKLGVALGPRTLATNKADLRPIVRTLLDPPPGRWVVSVADTGQIHTLPFTQVNTSRHVWTVRFERVDVRCSTAPFRAVMHAVCELLALGFRLDDIAVGEPTMSALARHPDAWERFAPALSSHFGSPLLELATFLTIKKDHRDDTRSYALAYAGGATGTGADAQREHQTDQPDRLVAARESGAADWRLPPDDRRDGVRDGGQAPDRSDAPRQLGFDF